MQDLIIRYGYLAVFLLMVAESACIPVPSEVTMLLGGALAGGAVAGAHLNLVAVVVAGVLGNLVGSYIAWAVGRYGGDAAWLRWGRYVGLRQGDIDVAQRWFDRHGNAAVFFSRLLPVVRTFISLPAGFARMPPVRFGLYTVAGCIPWTLGLAVAGYAVGANWQHIAGGFHSATVVIAVIVVVAVLAGVAVYVVRRRGRRRRHGGRQGGRHAPADSDPSDAPPGR